MIQGVVKLGGCVSGLKCRATRSPLTSRIALATPRAFEYCRQERLAQQALVDRDFDRELEFGLHFDRFWDRTGKTYYGLRLAYFDAGVYTRFPHLRGTERQVVAEEERIYNEASGLLWSPRSVVGRDLLFRMIGIETSGLEKLSAEECLQLGGILVGYRLAQPEERVLLDDIARLNIVDDPSGIIESKEETDYGVALTISLGRIRQNKTSRAWIRAAAWAQDLATGPTA